MQILNSDDIRERLRWPVVLGALRDAFRAKESFIMPERLMMNAPQGGVFLTMPCADGEGYFGVKQVSVLPGNAGRGLPTVQAWYTLFSPKGSPVLACDATLLTRIRTAGVSALAADYLAPKDARTLLVVGSGSLAPVMAEAHAQVRPYEQILLWARRSEAAEEVAVTLRSSLDTPVEVVTELEPALHAADVITVATTAREPIIRGASLRAGQHLDIVGAFTPEMAEADPEAVMRARVFVDDAVACRLEAGDLLQAEAQGWSFAGVMGDLQSLVREKVSLQAGELTLFKSVGLALEDLAVAKRLV